MTGNVATIIIEDKDYINKLLYNEPKDETEALGENFTYTASAYFPTGYTMDIKICGVSYDKYGCNLPWCEAVLFDENGQQVAYTEPQEEFFGTWCIDEYAVTVE